MITFWNEGHAVELYFNQFYHLLYCNFQTNESMLGCALVHFLNQTDEI